MVNVSFLEPLCSHGGHLGGPSLTPSLHKLSDDSMYNLGPTINELLNELQCKYVFNLLYCMCVFL